MDGPAPSRWRDRAGFLGERRGAVIGLATAATIVLALFLVDEEQAVVIGIITGAGYGLVALGLTLVYKSSGIFNFAQGEFGTVAVFALYLLHQAGWPYAFAVAGALVVAVALGLLTERLVIRPLAGAPRVTLLVATAGVALLCIGVELWIGGAKVFPLAPALRRLDRIELFGVHVSDQRLLMLLAVVVIGLALALFFNRTALGLAVLAASEEPTATSLVGIRVTRISALVWGLAALLGGVAGVLTGPIAGFPPGFLTLGPLIAGFTAAVIGGFTSLPGAFLGGVIVGVAQSVATSAPIFDSVPGPQSAAVFVLLLVILLVRPQGLLGEG